MGYHADEKIMIATDFTLGRKSFTLSVHETFGAGITGIFGPSGSGKSSLLKAIAGLEHPESGTIAIADRTMYHAGAKINIPVHKRNIGYVFQDGRLFPHITVEKNLRYGIKRNRPRTLSFDEVVDMLKLRHLLGSRPASISGGEYQRTALGRALLSSPDILLLDEPFSAVDAGLRSQIIPYLLKLQHRIAVPMLVVSHELPDLLKLTDRICVINQGSIIGHDDYHTLLGNPRVSEIFGTGTVLNAINTRVDRIEESQKLTILSSANGKGGFSIICERSRQPYAIGQELRIFIQAHDIALASQPLSDITIQNQLRGTVTDIYNRNSGTYCIVDAGERLVVEIAAASLNRLAITRGTTVWCLFKSVAIDVAT